MASDSPQPHISFIILSCVFLTTHFNNDDNERFDEKHTGSSVLVGNTFITNEHNYGGQQFFNWVLMIFGKPNFSDTYLLLSLICSSWDFSLSTFIMGCSDKGNFVGVAVGHCGASSVGSDYRPHYISDMKNFIGFGFHFTQRMRDWIIYRSDEQMTYFIHK